MLALWLLPLVSMWVRFDQFPHARYLLLSIILWPALLFEELLRAYGGWESWAFIIGLFQFVPVVMAALLLLCITQLVDSKTTIKPTKYFLPAVIVLVGQIPLLIKPFQHKVDYLLLPPVGDILQNWPYFASYLFSGFVILMFAIRAIELIAIYHHHLSDQVVDINYYKFSGANTAYVGLVIVAFISIIVTTLALFNLIYASIWQSLINLTQAIGFLFVMMVLLEKRRYSPSPLDPNKLEAKHFSHEYLQHTLKMAEKAVIRTKAYKHLGLTIKQLAKAADVDPQALAVATRSILNRNFRAFIYHYRLEYAKKILLRTDAKVSNVARRLGFNSEAYLSDMFIKYVEVMGKQQRPKDKLHSL